MYPLIFAAFPHVQNLALEFPQRRLRPNNSDIFSESGISSKCYHGAEFSQLISPTDLKNLRVLKWNPAPFPNNILAYRSRGSEDDTSCVYSSDEETDFFSLAHNEICDVSKSFAKACPTLERMFWGTETHFRTTFWRAEVLRGMHCALDVDIQLDMKTMYSFAPWGNPWEVAEEFEVVRVWTNCPR